MKTELISIIDKFFFGELLPKINLSEFIICVASDHATPCELKAHSDDPVPVLISDNKIRGNGTAKFSEKECRKGSLGILQNGSQFMPRLMDFIKK